MIKQAIQPLIDRLLGQADAGLVTVTLEELDALARAAQFGDRLRWRINGREPEFVTRAEIETTFAVKLAAMAARRELPALRSKEWQEREWARKSLAAALIDNLLNAYVLVRKYRNPNGDQIGRSASES
ncbi:hypothetical protein sos41_31690 [Alphaproteobacteria bacterium SO-S41]|nr:hypothetical protein sos41_31690 [Alphaproteobacteria bacterium SO-S41]